MIGSKVLAKPLETPRRNPTGVPSNNASAYPFATSTSEYHVKRKIPWSISPRLANGSMMYCLLDCQVLSGEGKSLAHVALNNAQITTTTATPNNGSRMDSSFLISELFIALAFQVVDRKTFRVSLQVARGIERHPVEQYFLLMVRSAMGIAALLHRLL